METNTSTETEAAAKNIDEVLAEKGYKDTIRVDADVRLTPSNGFFYALSASGVLLQNDSLSKMRDNLFEAERRAEKTRRFVVPPAKVLVETPKGWKTATYLGFVRGKGHRFELDNGTTFDSGTGWQGPRICRDVDRCEQLQKARVDFDAADEKLKKLNDSHTTTSYSCRGNDAGECLEATKQVLRILGVEYDRSDEAKK